MGQRFIKHSIDRKSKLKYFSAKYYYLLIVAIGFTVIFWFIPSPEFNQPYSKSIYASNGSLLGAQIASDGQWRFKELDSLPPNFEMALLNFEDQRFYEHTGVDLLALLRALKINIKANRIKSGASTITMQLARMSRGLKSRTIKQKLIEIFIALKTEITLSKKDILNRYASHAPFGGNIVGLEAASWRYFSKAPETLSLSESALLAVLPNAPSLIHPGRNRDALNSKRNKLLISLYERELIDSTDYELALLEKMPEKPLPLPRLAPHLLDQAFLSHNDYKINSTINLDIQKSAIQTANTFHQSFEQNGIHNLAILIAETKTGNVVAYVGNSPAAKKAKDVDMIQAERSSGSVLKPLLYAHALEDGIILPKSLQEDIPVDYNGYKPKNYNKSFFGAVPADQALAKSLNVPAVNLLKKYDTARFLSRLREHGFSSFQHSSDHYGLSLILGGGEIKLWDLVSSYASLGRILVSYKENESQYNRFDLRKVQYTSSKYKKEYQHQAPLISAAAIHHTFEAMKKLSRPNEEGLWELFSSSNNISWKTGTSYGHKDAWALGLSPEYTIGVWVGNANGEGRHNLVGVKKAAPILFDLFNKLPGISSFKVPYDDLEKTAICSHTGFLANKYCKAIDTSYIIKSNHYRLCPYHKLINLDEEGYQVDSECCHPSNMEQASWLVLPPAMASYYRKNHPEYQALPATRPDCESVEKTRLLSLIYPRSKTKIYLPVGSDGFRENAVFKAAHQNSDSQLFWHLDNKYLGMTEDFHTMNISASPGEHKILLIDNSGHSVQQSFEVVGME